MTVDTDDVDVQKQRGFRERNPEKPVLSLTADRYAKWYLAFCPTGEATRSALAEEFVARARDAAEEYVEMERCSRPDWWNDFTRDPESRAWMREHLAHRQAWAVAIDLLWHYSDDEQVDAHAIREALVRQSLRRHREGTRRARHEETAFCTAARIVRETAGLERMPEARRAAIREDYR